MPSNMVRPVLNLRNVDLNLLVALDALLAERSVTGAGRRIGLSQSAMSAALARLRIVFRDPLLVRSGRNLVLTQRAEELIIRFARFLAALSRRFQKAPNLTRSLPRAASQSARPTMQRSCCLYPSCAGFWSKHPMLQFISCRDQRRRPSAEDRPGRHGYRAA